MVNSRSQIFLTHLLHKITIVLTVIVLGTAISPTLKAQPVNSNFSFPNQQVINGLVAPTNSQLFFEEGMRQFETEIQNLRDGKHYPPEDLLKIDEGVLAPESLHPLENPQLVRDTEQLK